MFVTLKDLEYALKQAKDDLKVNPGIEVWDFMVTAQETYLAPKDWTKKELLGW